MILKYFFCCYYISGHKKLKRSELFSILTSVVLSDFLCLSTCADSEEFEKRHFGKKQKRFQSIDSFANSCHCRFTWETLAKLTEIKKSSIKVYFSLFQKKIIFE